MLKLKATGVNRSRSHLTCLNDLFQNSQIHAKDGNEMHSTFRDGASNRRVDGRPIFVRSARNSRTNITVHERTLWRLNSLRNDLLKTIRYDFL